MSCKACRRVSGSVFGRADCRQGASLVAAGTGSDMDTLVTRIKQNEAVNTREIMAEKDGPVQGHLEFLWKNLGLSHFLSADRFAAAGPDSFAKRRWRSRSHKDADNKKHMRNRFSGIINSCKLSGKLV